MSMHWFRLTCVSLVWSTVMYCAALGPAPCHAQGHEAEVEQLDSSNFQGKTWLHGDASHAEGGHGNTNPLSIDPDLMLFTLIIFLLTLMVLAKFAWGPIKEALERREQSIADQISEAQKSRDEARRLLEQYESRLATAREEINSLMDGARREAEAQKAVHCGRSREAGGRPAGARRAGNQPCQECRARGIGSIQRGSGRRAGRTDYWPDTEGGGPCRPDCRMRFTNCPARTDPCVVIGLPG